MVITWRRLLMGTLLLYVIVWGLWGVWQPLPEGLSYASDIYPIADEQLIFLADHTFIDETGTQQFEHTIFATLLQEITQAEDYLLIDMFLFNDQLGMATSAHQALAHELSDALVRHMSDYPEAQRTLITDPINTAYGSYWPEPLQRLREAGIEPLLTDLTALRDSNPLYSSWYRAGLRFIPDIGGNFIPNPFDPEHERVTLSAVARGLNFKANHRKVFVGGSQTETSTRWRALVTSLNPHDGSSRHNNVALMVKGHPIIKNIIQTEQAVANFSGNEDITPTLPTPVNATSTEMTATIRLLTEQAIKTSVLKRIDDLQAGDQLDLFMFYFSDRDIVRAIKEADARGVNVRIILDPNKDAFGREKNGIPNRQVAYELHRASVGNTEIRWCATHGEQCHSKLLLTSRGDDDIALSIGSTNFTRRNLNNLNLETNLEVRGTSQTTALRDAQQFFTQHWDNQDGRLYTVPYETYEDSNRWRVIWYRIGEFTGMSLF